jgi:hypothetical protein
MAGSRTSAWLAALLVAGSSLARAAGLEPPAPLARVGTTEKICQLTGDADWETGRPTAASTFANFGLDAADLGYPVEHGGKLILLFGDSWPPRHPAGPAGEIPPDDAVGVVLRKTPPADDGKCLELQVHRKPGTGKVFAPATVIAPEPIKQGFFNVPSGGISAGDRLYAFFWTNHCSPPTPLKPSREAPLARPAPGATCSETDDRSSIGTAVMARSDDEGWTFRDPAPMPPGFVYSTAIDTAVQADLPADQRLGILVFGVPRYRASVPYLAQAPIGSFAEPATWRFFAGLGADGQPKWVTQAQWSGGNGAPKVPAASAWRPPGEPEIFVPSSPQEECIGEFSITWNRPLGMWLMLYNCPGGIWARIAPAPWGPWSAPARILSRDDDVACRLVMVADGCGSRRDFWPARRRGGKFVAGNFYAPYVLDRYTSAAGADVGPRRSTIYWLVSSWNPYEVTVMRTTLQRDAR